MIEVSVIIPNYNHAAFLKARIESVLQQSFVNFEIIIMDDASTDNSKEIIELYRNHPKISQIIYNKANSGSPFIQWAKGIALAKGNWIWIAESDDTSENDFLKIVWQLAQENPKASLIYSDASIIDPAKKYLTANKFSELKNKDFNTNKWDDNYIREGKDELVENLAFVCTINNASSALLRKDKLSECIGVMSGFTYHGDWYSYIFLALHGTIVYSSKVVCSVRMHENSLLNREKDFHGRKKEYFKILLFLLNQPTGIQRKKLISFFSEQYLNFGLSQTIRMMFIYLSINFPIGIKVLWNVFFIKIIGKKIKQYFN